MTHSIDHQMTEIYCFIDDFLQSRPAFAKWRHSPHAAPKFSDSEVITIALLQNVFGVATLKQTYRLVAHAHRAAFPRLPTYPQWINRLHNSACRSPSCSL